MRLLCWVIGHNKTLERTLEDGFENYYTVCSQCGKRWLDTELCRPLPVKKKQEKQKQAPLQTVIVKQKARSKIPNIYLL